MSKTVIGKKTVSMAMLFFIFSPFLLGMSGSNLAQQSSNKGSNDQKSIKKQRKVSPQSDTVNNAEKKEKISQDNGIPTASDKTDELDHTKKQNEKRIKLAQDVLQDIFKRSENMANPVVRIKVRMLIADAYWNYEPNIAKEILLEDFPKIASISVPQHEHELGKLWSVDDLGKPVTYKGRNLEEVKAQLKREMLTIISARDSALARSLVASERNDEKKSDTSGESRDEVLMTAAILADTDPEAAARIIRESSKSGISDELPFLLIRLREKSPEEASSIFNQAFSIARMNGDLWNFQKLVPYILPTEKDRLIGGKHYLTDPQRMKDAITLIDYGIELLVRRIETEPPGNMTAELVRREFYLWWNLLAVFKDIKPESVWLINTRINQLSAFIPQSEQRPTQGPWSDERQKQLMIAVASSTGDKRDAFLESAAFNAWRMGQGDFDQAISLAEKIENKEQREGTLGTLYFQAGLKALSTEGPDKALQLAEKDKLPKGRVSLYAAIIGALVSAKATERAEALKDDLLNWLQSRNMDTDTAWGTLDFLDRFSRDNSERGFAALEIFVTTMNGADLTPPDKPMRRKIYWYPEFHDFRKSLASLARADFERGLQIIQTLNNAEAAMLVQASFCGEYLKSFGKNKTGAKPRP